MADDHGQNRTEAPTPRRREEARKHGDVALSPDLTGGLLLLAGLLVLWLGGTALARGLLETVQRGLLDSAHTELDLDSAREVVLTSFGRGMELIALLLGLLFAVGMGAGVLQAGFGLSVERLAPNWEHLSPARGLSRMFSLSSAVRALLALLKVAAVVLVAYLVLRGRADRVASLSEAPLSQGTAEAWALSVRVALSVAAALVVLGVIDYLFRRFRLEQSLRMTRQELREEVKREEGDPALRSRIRRLQRAAVQRRMFDDVPRSSVVVTNPAHLAIALCYERGTMSAPRVLARGSGLIARRIVDLARRHAVPVVERKPLARALFRSVQVGQEIPAALYHAVAEVLAYVYRLRGGLSGLAGGGA